MTTLPNPQLEQLLPILSNLVKAINADVNVSDIQIEIFLETLSLEEEDWALKEVKKWVKLLKRVKLSNDPEILKAVEISLLSIGIPPANVNIAFSELKNTKNVQETKAIYPVNPEDIPPPKLNVSTEKLYFGQIELGKSKSLNFFVEGSSGIIENEIECLHFNKTRFREIKEEIIATMSGGSEGEIFFDKICLKTKYETKVILIHAEFVNKAKDIEKPVITKIFKKSNFDILQEKLDSLKYDVNLLITENKFDAAFQEVNKVYQSTNFSNIEDKQFFDLQINLIENMIKEKFSKYQNISKPTTKTQVINNAGFVLVEGGPFMMGDTLGNGYNDEKPVHKVTLTYNFLIGKYQVTQGEYESLMGINPSYFKGYNLPVETVSWFEAIKYCNSLSLTEGLPLAYNEDTGDLLDSSGKATNNITVVKGYRLPTEAEWEYAARGGKYSKGYKYAGSNDPDKVSWYSGNSFSKTHPVGSKAPNELDIYDMSGNVWEWTTDWYRNYTSLAVTNPYIWEKAFARVFRGGSWNSNALRVEYRRYDSNCIRNNLGFRLVRTAS